MTLPEIIEKCKTREVYTAALIILVAFASFGLGRLSKIEETRVPIQIEYPQTTAATRLVGGQDAATAAALLPPQTKTGGQVVAAKTGAKYYFPWCSGAARISDANKVWFNSIEEARKAGYAPASNCKGLK